MKYFILLLFCSTFLSSSFGQEKSESISYSEETTFFEEQEFKNAYDFVFQTHEETKSLFKVDLTGILTSSPYISSKGFELNNDLEFAFEQKIGTAFSINTSIGLRYEIRKNAGLNNNQSLEDIGITLTLQPRWYFNLKKNIKKGKTANNLSGYYLALDYTFDHHGEKRGNFGERDNNTLIGFRVGLQRRIFGRGYIDIQLGPQKTNNRQDWGITSKVGLGITFGKKRLSLDADQKCNIFQCYEEQKRMFKIDLLNLINFRSQFWQVMFGDLTLGYEQKIGKSWSINAELEISYLYAETKENLFGARINEVGYSGGGLRLEGRYYYDLKKRIASGLSANNLSGNYFGVRIESPNVLYYSNDVPEGTARFGVHPKPVFKFSPIWGMQRTIFKRGFIDYNIGLNFNDDVREPFQNELLNRGLLSGQGLHLNFSSKLRIGVYF